ncbi:unnamed protein product [marine sediment metagenome]|uniref:Type II secretion system protein GspG C-terminal domain-containing protein n=1 Tax=marine sediment metagenome TaxID=412755 RepID=X1BZC9_9ZZZZ
MEILLVAAILIILASMATIAFRGIGKETTATLTRTEIESFEHASEMFAMRHMRLPNSLDELFTSVNGSQPFMKEGDRLDPWGVEYKFSVDTERDMVIIQSAGPDGQFNTADDVTNDPRQQKQTAKS